MPILIRGNGGAKEFASITAKDTGEIVATTKKGTSHHWLSNRDDADFVAENIKSGVNIFGKMGTFKGYERIAGINAEGKQVITIPCSFRPKGIMLLPTDDHRSSVSAFTFGVSFFVHFSEINYGALQTYAVGSREYRRIEFAPCTNEEYIVRYSENSVTAEILFDGAFMSTCDAIVFG